MRKLDGNLYIRKRAASEWAVAFVFFLPFFQAFFAEFLGLPDILKFLADVALFFLLVKIVLISRQIQIGKFLYPFLFLIGIFIGYVTVTYFMNYQSVFYYIWGLRNYFRFYLAFVCYVIFLPWDNVQTWFKVLDRLYVINFFVVMVQFFMGYRQDFLGGIFGISKGCNGGVLVFLTVVLTKVILDFMRNEGSTIKCLVFSSMGLLISALSELKFFFVIFIGILIMATVMTKSSVKKTLFLFFGVVLIIVLSTLLSVLYDDFSDFLSIKNLWNSLINPNYATDEDVGRMTAIPIISERFLPNFMDKLLGIGIGNADSSSIGIFNTPFYDMYGDLHYAIFLYAFLYLETGIIGLSLYTLFFVIAFVTSFYLYKTKKGAETICQLAMIFSVSCIAFMFYNVALRSEMAAYLAFFVLALPLISAGETTLKEDI